MLPLHFAPYKIMTIIILINFLSFHLTFLFLAHFNSFFHCLHQFDRFQLFQSQIRIEKKILTICMCWYAIRFVAQTSIGAVCLFFNDLSVINSANI